MRITIPFFRMVCNGALLCVGLASCYKNHLYVQQEWIDANFLASSHVGSPDPRSIHPPEGTGLLIGWNFPRCLFLEQLLFVITVRFWDQTEEIRTKIIHHRRGSDSFYFPNPGDLLEKRILAYKIDVFSENGALLETWKHHFWVELIEFNTESAQRSHSCVSSQPKQGSVTERP